MTWSISASGWKGTESEGESREHEELVAEEFAKFLKAIQGLGGTVSGATFSGGHIGYRDLLGSELIARPQPVTE